MKYLRRHLRIWAFLVAALISAWLAFGPVYSVNGGPPSLTMAQVNGDRIYKWYAMIAAVSALPLLWKPLTFVSGVLLAVVGCIHMPWYLIPAALLLLPEHRRPRTGAAARV